MRWDFGFTCAFCLLNEADFHHGLTGEGLGVTSIEHFIPRSAEKARSLAYDNCIYACRLCNGARSNRPVRKGEARLLDPTREPWSDHFERVDDQIIPKDGNVDAAYTESAYDLNEARRVERRERRRRLLTDRLKLLRRLNTELLELQERAMRIRRKNRSKFVEIWITIGEIRREGRRVLEILEMYRAIPRDAAGKCRCGVPDNHSLPEELEWQTLEVAPTL